MVHRKWILCVTIIAIVYGHDEKVEIPGCVDLESLPSNLADLESEQIARLRCLCSPSKKRDSQQQMGVTIMCIYGSKLRDLKHAMQSIEVANRTIHRISINHMTFEDEELDDNLNEIDSLKELQNFEIRSCHGSTALNISQLIPIHMPLEALTEVSIEDCKLEEMPQDLLKRSQNLRTLNLRKNKIIRLKKEDMESVANSLENLDLSGNLLADVEPNAIGQLKQLKKLHIGEHNSIRNLTNELGKLTEIRTLDLTRIDGLDDLSKINFSQTSHLENLILTGCNIRSITTSHLKDLSSLKKLDLRVNLIETIEEGSFRNLTRLDYLSLAGNFLNDTNFGPRLWDGLKNLRYLDIGWNEVTQISKQFFEHIQSHLQALDLSHNEKLTHIEEGAFDGMENLERLNLNGCGLKNVTMEIFRGLINLKELDLSFNSIEFIEDEAFNTQNKKLQQLFLDGNRLRQVNVTFLDNLLNLTEVNIADNPLLCDENGKNLTVWVRNKYRVAAQNGNDFLLKNSQATVCDRPLKLKGRPLLDVEDEDFAGEFDENLDTTTASELMTTTESDSKTSTLNFESLFVVIGNRSDETILGDDGDKGKPIYDINSIKYGEERHEKSPHDWIGIVTVGILVVASLVGIIVAINRRKQGAQQQQSSNNNNTETKPTS